MANYIPTDWQDEIVDGEGNVVQEGTPLSAANLTKLEAGVEDAVAAVVGKVDGVVFDQFKTAITTQLAEKAKYIEDFKKQVPEVDDTARMQRAFNSGGNIFLKYKGIYNVDTVKIWTSNIDIIGNYATIKAKTKFSHCFLIGSNIAGGFTKVVNILLDNLNFEGIEDTYSGEIHGSIGISVKESTFVRGAGCENIRVQRCDFKKLTSGIMANGTTGLTIKECSSGGHYFSSPDSNGGYGILLQTCFDVDIHHNKFKGAVGDRHAIYVSCAVGVIVPNEDINIHDNEIDFTNVLDITGFESAFVIRSVVNLKCKDNKIKGSYGGIRVLSSHGNSKYLNITGNAIAGIRFKNNQVGAIDVMNDGYNITDIIVTDNMIDTDIPSVMGVTLFKADRVTVSNNRVKSKTYGLIIQDSTNVKYSGNNFELCESAAVMYRGTLTGIEAGVNFTREVTGTPIRIIEPCTIGSLKHFYTRKAGIVGTGTVASYNYDPDKIIGAVAGDPFGVKITFTKAVKITRADDISITPITATPYYYNVRGIDAVANSVVVGISTNINNVLTPIDLSTVSASLTISLNV